MSKSGGSWFVTIVLLLSASLFGGVSPVYAGEDKGTIGITCRPPQSTLRYEVTNELSGKQAARAEEEFRTCVRKVVEGWSDREIKANLLMLEKTVDSRDGGVEVPMVEGYTDYRNAIEAVTAERKKAKAEKKSTGSPSAPKKNP